MLSTLLLIAAALLAAAVLLLAVHRIASNRTVAAAWQSLALSSAGDKFVPEMVAALPEPARRYLLHAIQPGARLASSVEVEMRGEIRLSPQKGWMPMSARQILAAPGGFVWKASIGGLLRFTGSDHYANRQGRMIWHLWGVIPVVVAAGEDITRSARGRMAAELVWLPSMLLPERGARWTAVDENTAQATVNIDGESFTLTITVARDGAVTEVMLDRWGNQDTEGGRYATIPFAVTISGEARFGGYTLPTRLTAGWWANTDRYRPFFRAEVTTARHR